LCRTFDGYISKYLYEKIILKKKEEIKVEEDSEDYDKDFLVKRKSGVNARSKIVKGEEKDPEEIITKSLLFENRFMKKFCEKIDKEDDKIKLLKKNSSDKCYVENKDEILSSCYLFSSVSSFDKKKQNIEGSQQNKYKSNNFDASKMSSLPLSSSSSIDLQKKKFFKNSNFGDYSFENNKIFLMNSKREYLNNYELRFLYTFLCNILNNIA
jgi:hypothetical protein